MENNIPITKSISVDASCLGNPGPMEYKGIWTENGQVLFSSKRYTLATNNIGEFLALVHALAYCKKKNVPKEIPIYSDSQTAIAWVKKGKCDTLFPRTENNKDLFDIIDRANKFLKENTFLNRNPVLKWDTGKWGEIGADFGRKFNF